MVDWFDDLGIDPEEPLVDEASFSNQTSWKDKLWWVEKLEPIQSDMRLIPLQMELKHTVSMFQQASVGSSSIISS